MDEFTISSYRESLKGYISNPESGFAELDRDKRGEVVNWFTNYFADKNQLTEEDRESLDVEAESIFKRFKQAADYPRTVLHGEQFLRAFGGLPEIPEGAKIEDKIAAIDKWKEDAVLNYSKYNPAESEDGRYQAEAIANSYIREEVAKDNKTSWLGDKTYRAIEGFVRMGTSMPFVDVEWADRFLAENLPENPETDENIDSMIFSGIGELASQALASLASSVTMGPQSIPYTLGILYSARAMKEGYDEEIKRSGDSAKALDVAVASVPGALVETTADTLLYGASKSIKKTVGAAWRNATTEEAKRQILKELLPSRGKEILKQGISEATVGAIGADFATGYGRYLASGDDKYIPTAEELLKGGLVEGLLGAGYTSLFGAGNIRQQTKELAEGISEIQGETFVIQNREKTNAIFEALRKKDFAKAIELSQSFKAEQSQTREDKIKAVNGLDSEQTDSEKAPVNKIPSRPLKPSHIRNLERIAKTQEEEGNLEKAQEIRNTISAAKGGTYVASPKFSLNLKEEPEGYLPAQTFESESGTETVDILSTDDGDIEVGGSVFYVSGIDPSDLNFAKEASGGVGILTDGNLNGRIVFNKSGKMFKDNGVKLKVSDTPKKGYFAVKIGDKSFNAEKGFLLIKDFEVVSGKINSFKSVEVQRGLDQLSGKDKVQAIPSVKETISDLEGSQFGAGGLSAMQNKVDDAMDALKAHVVQNPEDANAAAEVGEYLANLLESRYQQLSKLAEDAAIGAKRPALALPWNQVEAPVNPAAPVKITPSFGDRVAYEGYEGTFRRGEYGVELETDDGTIVDIPRGDVSNISFISKQVEESQVEESPQGLRYPADFTTNREGQPVLSEQAGQLENYTPPDIVSILTPNPPELTSEQAFGGMSQELDVVETVDRVQRGILTPQEGGARVMPSAIEGAIKNINDRISRLQNSPAENKQEFIAPLEDMRAFLELELEQASGVKNSGYEVESDGVYRTRSGVKSKILSASNRREKPLTKPKNEKIQSEESQVRVRDVSDDGNQSPNNAGINVNKTSSKQVKGGRKNKLPVLNQEDLKNNPADVVEVVGQDNLPVETTVSQERPVLSPEVQALTFDLSYQQEKLQGESDPNEIARVNKNISNIQAKLAAIANTNTNTFPEAINAIKKEASELKEQDMSQGIERNRELLRQARATMDGKGAQLPDKLKKSFGGGQQTEGISPGELIPDDVSIRRSPTYLLDRTYTVDIKGKNYKAINKKGEGWIILHPSNPEQGLLMGKTREEAQTAIANLVNNNPNSLVGFEDIKTPEKTSFEEKVSSLPIISNSPLESIKDLERTTAIAQEIADTPTYKEQLESSVNRAKKDYLAGNRGSKSYTAFFNKFMELFGGYSISPYQFISYVVGAQEIKMQDASSKARESFISDFKKYIKEQGLSEKFWTEEKINQAADYYVGGVERTSEVISRFKAPALDRIDKFVEEFDKSLTEKITSERGEKISAKDYGARREKEEAEVEEGIKKISYSVSSGDLFEPISIKQAADFIASNDLPVQVVDTKETTDNGNDWNGRTIFTNNGPIIQVNVANIGSVEELRNIINEEIAHVIYNNPELASLLDPIASTTQINEALADLGYPQDQLQEESVVKRVADLVDLYNDKGTFDKIISTIKVWLKENLGISLSENDLKYVAYRAINRAVKDARFSQPTISGVRNQSEELSPRNVFQFRLANEFRKGDVVLGLKIANDGTVPVQNITAKIRKSGANEFEIDRLTELAEGLAHDGRVNVKELSDVIDTEPTVVINTLSSDSNINPKIKRLSEIRHEFETIGFGLSIDAISGPTKIKVFGLENDLDVNDLDEKGKKLYKEAVDLGITAMDFEPSRNERQAATGRFGVDPYSKEELDGALEISPGHRLIWSGDLSLNVPGNEKFSSQHYSGDVAKNQLAFVRGGIHEYQPGTKLPDGTTATETTRIMEIWEVQSDWDGKLKRDREMDARQLEIASQGLGPFVTSKPEQTSPLLKYWESLALKAALNYAQQQGANNIIISDAETAMMTERHDASALNSPRNIDSFETKEEAESFSKTVNGFVLEKAMGKGWNVEWVDLKNIVITQEQGMRAAYDQRIPDGLKKLTGSKPKKVTITEHYKGPSKVFKNPDGTPKNTNTGVMFTVPRDKNFIRFSRSDKQKQKDKSPLDSEFESDSLLSSVLGKTSEDQVHLLRILNKARKLRLEQKLIVDEPQVWTAIKRVDAGYLNESDIKGFIDLVSNFINTRRRVKEPIVGIRRSTGELIAEIEQYTQRADQAHFESLQDEFEFLRDKTFGDYDNDIGLVLEKVRDHRKANEDDSIFPQGSNEAQDNYIDRIQELQSLFTEEPDFVKNRFEEALPEIEVSSNNPLIDKYKDKIKDEFGSRVNTDRAFYKSYLQFLMRDPTDLTFKQVRDMYYGLQSFFSDGYILNASNFISQETRNLIDTFNVDLREPFSGKWSDGMVFNTGQISNNLRRMGSQVYEWMNKLITPFREGINQAERVHQTVVQPYLKDALNKAHKIDGVMAYTPVQQNQAGIYAMARQYKIGEGIASGLLETKRWLESSVNKYINSYKKSEARSAKEQMDFIQEIYTGITENTKDEDALRIVEENAARLIPEGMRGFVNDVAALYEATKPLAKYTSEVVYGRKFEEWANYIPAFSMHNQNGGIVNFEMNSNDNDLSMRGAIDDASYMKTGGGSTKQRKRYLGEGRVLVFNINHLADNRMRLAMLDYFTATHRRELHEVMGSKAFKEAMDDKDLQKGRVLHLNKTVQVLWNNSIQSASFVTPFQAGMNVITSWWARGKLSSFYQFPAQFASNIVPFFVVNAMNPTKIKYFLQSINIVAKYQFGMIEDPRLKNTLDKILYSIRQRQQEVFMDRSVSLDLNSSQMKELFLKTGMGQYLTGGAKKVNESLDSALYLQFKWSDILSGSPVMLAEYMDREVKAGRISDNGTENAWESLTYNPESYNAALDETERFIGVGAASRRGVWLNNKNGWMLVFRNIISAFSSHRVNNANNFVNELRTVFQTNSNEERFKSLQYMTGIVAQSAMFTYIKYLFVMGFYNLLSDKMGEGEDEEELEKILTDMASKNVAKQDQDLVRAEISMRKKIRAEWDNVKRRNNDEKLLVINFMKDVFSNAFIIPAVTETPLNSVLHIVYDKSEQEIFKQAKEGVLDDLKNKLEFAKKLKDYSGQAKLELEIARIGAQDALLLAQPKMTSIPFEGAYGGFLNDLSRLAGKFSGKAVDAQSFTINDLFLVGGVFGMTPADVNKIARIVAKREDYEHELKEKIEEINEKKFKNLGGVK